MKKPRPVDVTTDIAAVMFKVGLIKSGATQNEINRAAEQILDA